MRNQPRFSFPFVVVLAILIVAGAVAFSTWNNQGLAIGGSVRQNSSIANVPQDIINSPGVLRWVIMDFDPATVQGDNPSITIPFSSGSVTLPLKRDSVEYDKENADDFTWYGQLQDNDFSSAVIVWKKSYVAASFKVARRNEEGRYLSYSIFPYANGKGIAVEVDPSQQPPLNDKVIDPVAEGLTNADETSLPLSETAVEIQSKKKMLATFSGRTTIAQLQSVPIYPTIDVMVVYTHAAMLKYGTTPQAIETCIQLWVAEMQQALVRSKAQANVRLVHTYETLYVETNNLDIELGRLQYPSEGYMDEAHTKRNQYGADLVMLVSAAPNPNYGGIAYIWTPAMGFGGSDRGFAVISGIWPWYSSYLLAHEFGHNLGMGHDVPNPSGGTASAYAFSHGYYSSQSVSPLNTRIKTIMSYDCHGTPCTSIPYYSNPAVNYYGTPTGSSAASNADTLKTIYSPNYSVARVISEYRFTSTLPLPPTNVYASDGIHLNYVKLTWNASQNSTSYDIYRNETLIGNTTATEFLDTPPAPDVVYSYTVKGRNAQGVSSASNADTGFSITPNSTMGGPTHFQVSTAWTDKVRVVWDAWVPINASQYSVYYYPLADPNYQPDVCQPQYLIQVVGQTNGASTLNLLVSGLTPASHYRFGIQAANQYIHSACIPLFVTTKPASVTNLQASIGQPEITLTWDRPSIVNEYMDYMVYRSTTPNFTPDIYGATNLLDIISDHRTGVDGKNIHYVDQGGFIYSRPLPNTTYYYRVVVQIEGYTSGYLFSAPSPEAAGSHT